MLDEIKRLPKKFVKGLPTDVDNLSVYVVQDFDMKLLSRIVKYGIESFGKIASNEFVIAPQIRQGNVYILKEEDSNKILGLAILMRNWEDANMAYLWDYSIGKKIRGMGIGLEFLKVIGEDLIDQNFERMSLTVDVENASAIKLYKDKVGFDEVLTRKDEYGKGEDRFFMELDLKEFVAD